MYKKELPRVTPESVGVSSRDLLKLFRRTDELGTELHGAMIARHGKVFCETWWKPYNKDTVHACHSFGKSYIGTAIGVAVTQGLITLDTKMADIFVDDIRRLGINTNGPLGELTVEHVLMMSNGMTRHPTAGEHLIDNYFTNDFNEKPGLKFHYNTSGTCMLGAIIPRLTGMTLFDYLTKYVFNKVGIETDKMNWMTFRSGLHAAPGVATTTENNLRLGMLYLRMGNWDGEQIVSSDYIERATTKRIETYPNHNPHPDANAGYGYQLWMNAEPGCYRFAGGQGQDALMCKKNDIVFAVHQSGIEPTDPNIVRDAVTEYLFHPDLPESLPEDPEGYAELKAYLDSRCIPDWESRPLPGDISDWEGIYEVKEGRFHIEPELHAVGNRNVNIDFYNRDKVDVKYVAIRKLDDRLEVCFDIARIIARFDGKLEPVDTRGAMPPYQTTVSTAYFEDEKTLCIDTKYLQTAFNTHICMVKDKDSIEMSMRKYCKVPQPQRDVIINGIKLERIV